MNIRLKWLAFVGFDVLFVNNEKKASYGLGNGVQVNDPLRVCNLLFLKVVGLAIGHKNPATYTYTQRTTRLRT